MKPSFAAWLSGWEILLVLALVLLLFGAKRLPDLAKGLGQSLKEFKKAAREDAGEGGAGAKPPPESGPSSSSDQPKH